MASAKKPKLPPSAEALAEVLRLFHESTAPLAASALAKSLLPPHKISAAQLEPILEEYVTTGTLYRIPAAKATGKPRYWNRDLIALVRTGLAETLQAADAPLTALELAARIPG
ncbi:MAG: hypothetical protein NT069_00905, partial [Planctomycetota bacterium]|nr:hypothetical protein [Planctomycetota bacterium]